MADDELAWLAEQAKTHYRILEVGSWMGRSTTALADNTPGIVFAVDTWQGSEEHAKELVGPPGWLFQKFQENMRGLPVIAMQGTSAAAAQHFSKGGAKFFDMIFIDGAHDFDNVKADIEAWGALLQPGGILCGHDLTTWPSVAEAVFSTLGEVQLPANSIWLKIEKENLEGDMGENITCEGSHRYFVAQDASYNGKVFILLVCTACGNPKKIEFSIAPEGTDVKTA